jgi:hypothetical protein
MHPILIVVASAVSFAITLWAVRSVLRSIFRTQAQNPLGVVLIAAGIWLFFFRVVTVAIPLLIFGAVLLLRKNGERASGSTTQSSKVRSAHLEMTLDHVSGTIDGRILTGKRQGHVLSNLALHELLKYYAEIQMDEESLKLFETFLDSAHPDWRDHEDENSARGEETSPLSRQLSRDEAYRLLGLEAGCGEEDIRRAYHRLIKRVHPDRGGSAVLTAQITEARDRLLGDR